MFSNDCSSSTVFQWATDPIEKTWSVIESKYLKIKSANMCIQNSACASWDRIEKIISNYTVVQVNSYLLFCTQKTWNHPWSVHKYILVFLLIVAWCRWSWAGWKIDWTVVILLQGNKGNVQSFRDRFPIHVCVTHLITLIPCTIRRWTNELWCPVI